MVRPLDSNPNWKGGVCNITHVDELLDLPEYAANRKLFIENNHAVVGECWNWTRSCFTSNGRARISIGVKSHLAARVSYVVFNSKPVGELLVCHSCDNVLCVNPKHLWLGTSADNSKDMVEKGRSISQKGKDNHASKLNNEIVVQIRKMLKLGIKQHEIAIMFEVSKSTINQINTNRIWRNV
jgi:predicted XRE-type DNA-binding protein